MLQKTQVEQEELEVLRDVENGIFGSLKETNQKQLDSLFQLDLNDVLELMDQNKGKKSVDVLAKLVYSVLWVKGAHKILKSGKVVPSWVDLVLKKAKVGSDLPLKSTLGADFPKRQTRFLMEHILTDKNLQKKLSAQMLPLRLLRAALLTKVSIEVKIYENKKFIKSLAKQESICRTFQEQLEACRARLESIRAEHLALAEQISESKANLASKRAEIKGMKHRLENSSVYQRDNQLRQAWDARVIDPQSMFLDALITGVYFSLGYQLSSDPMLLNGIKNMIVFNCDQFLMEETLNTLRQRPLINIFCKHSRIEKLFWGNYIFGIETLSKFQRINQCRLKFFIIRDPFEMCLSLVKEVAFKRDIVIVQNLSQLCINDMRVAIAEGKLFLLINVRLSDTPNPDLCGCETCLNVTQSNPSLKKNQTAVNFLLSLIEDPVTQMHKIRKDLEKDSLNFLNDSEDWSRSAKFQLMIFTKDVYQEFMAIRVLRQHCLFEEFLERRSDLEGKLTLLFMELLKPDLHQSYLLNCREILKGIKRAKHLHRQMVDLVLELEDDLIASASELGEFVSLRNDLSQCNVGLRTLKKKNAGILGTIRKEYNCFIQKIISMWRVALLICEYKTLRRVTIQEVLASLRKSISKRGHINLKRLSNFFFSIVKFSLETVERELLGAIFVFLVENSNFEVPIGQVIELALEEDSRFEAEGHPLMQLNQEMQVNENTTLNGFFNSVEHQKGDGSQNSLIFDHLILKNMRWTMQTGQTSQSRVSTMMSNLGEESLSKERLSEAFTLEENLAAQKVNSVIFSQQQISRLLRLEQRVRNLKGLVAEILKIENNFHEKTQDTSKPFWAFEFQLDGRRLDPIEMLLILKAVNFDKYLVDMGIFVQWYYSSLVLQKVPSKQSALPSESGSEVSKPNRQFQFGNFSVEELAHLVFFSKRNYKETTKDFYILMNLELDLTESIKQSQGASQRYFIDSMPEEGLVYLKSLAQKKNVMYNFFYIYTENQMNELWRVLQKSKDENRWLIIELALFSLDIFKCLDQFMHSLDQQHSSLHSFQIFIISPPNLHIFDIIPMKFRETFKYYRLAMKFPLSFTINKFFLCFKRILQVDKDLMYFHLEQLVRMVMHSSAKPAPSKPHVPDQQSLSPSHMGLIRERNKFLVRVLLSMSYVLSKKTEMVGSLSQQLYYQDVMNFITDSIVSVFKAHKATRDLVRLGDDARIKKLILFKLNRLKELLRCYLVTNFERVSPVLERINELLLSEFDSLRFSNELSVGIKNVIDDCISKATDLRSSVDLVHLSVCRLVMRARKEDITGLLNFDGVVRAKRALLDRLDFGRFSRFIRRNFDFECRLDQLKYGFYVQTPFFEDSSKLQIDYRTLRNSELFASKCFDNLSSMSQIPNLVLNLWRYSYLSVDYFCTKIREVILRHLLACIPRKININLVEIKYQILKKDPLDELFISEYYRFNQNISRLGALLLDVLDQVHSGINSPTVSFLVSNVVPPCWRDAIHCCAYIYRATDLMDYLAQQRTYFLMVIEKNFKFLFDLKFFENPRITLQVAKQVLSKQLHTSEHSLEEEYQFYKSAALSGAPLADIENRPRNGYFISGLFLMGCRLHYVDQKLTEDVRGGSIFSRSPLVMVRLVPKVETQKNVFTKFHSLPVYRRLPDTLRPQVDPLKPSLKNPQICLECLQFFCNNVQHFQIKDDNFMKLIYELRGRLSGKSFFNFYRLQEIPPAFSKILVNLNQICVHRQPIHTRDSRSIGIHSFDDFNDYFLLSLRFPTIEKEEYWVKQMAYAVLVLPSFFHDRLN